MYLVKIRKYEFTMQPDRHFLGSDVVGSHEDLFSLDLGSGELYHSKYLIGPLI